MSNKSWFPDTPSRRLGDRMVGTGQPVYITGEIGINHNGDLANAIALIDQAADAGCERSSSRSERRKYARRVISGTSSATLRGAG